ncbi:MAG: CHRD domain-containing protein [Conexibacter sp.]
MQRVTAKLAVVVAIVGMLTASAVAVGKNGADGKDRGSSVSKSFRATLTGYEEVPAISSPASASFKATLNRAGDRLSWRLSYRGIATPIQQAHIHFGQPAVNGGVSAFLCSNLPGTPAGVQACPAPPARISGTIRAQDVVGPAAQGIAPGELGELVSAMRAGVTYANLHSDAFPNGEIRGQIHGNRR